MCMSRSEMTTQSCSVFLNDLPTNMLMMMGPMQGKTVNELLECTLYYEEIDKKPP